MSSIIWLLFWYSDILLGLFREGPTLYGGGARCGRWGGSLRPRRQSWAQQALGVLSAGAGVERRWPVFRGCVAEVFDGVPARLCCAGRKRGVRWNARMVVLVLVAREVFKGMPAKLWWCFLVAGGNTGGCWRWWFVFQPPLSGPWRACLLFRCYSLRLCLLLLISRFLFSGALWLGPSRAAAGRD